MFKKITTDYNGGDATGEIIIMLLGAFILGFLLRWIWDKFHNCVEEYEEFIIEDKETPKVLEKKKKTTVKKEVVTSEVVSKKREDDLKIIEGIGPKIESIFKAAGILSWEDLMKENEDSLREILKAAGDNYAFHNPKTWPDQAKLAHQGQWEELEEFQDFLNGGKE